MVKSSTKTEVKVPSTQKPKKILVTMIKNWLKNLPVKLEIFKHGLTQ